MSQLENGYTEKKVDKITPERTERTERAETSETNQDSWEKSFKKPKAELIKEVIEKYDISSEEFLSDILTVR